MNGLESAGGVVLMGDAIHAFPPDLGQVWNNTTLCFQPTKVLRRAYRVQEPARHSLGRVLSYYVGTRAGA